MKRALVFSLIFMAAASAAPKQPLKDCTLVKASLHRERYPRYYHPHTVADLYDYRRENWLVLTLSTEDGGVTVADTHGLRGGWREQLNVGGTYSYYVDSRNHFHLIIKDGRKVNDITLKVLWHDKEFRGRDYR